MSNSQESTGAAKAARIGKVTSDKRDKSRRVEIPFMTAHPKYGKFVKNRTVLHAHDENNESRRGDTVEIVPCRPISRTKSWKIVRIVERGKVEFSPTEPAAV